MTWTLDLVSKELDKGRLWKGTGWLGGLVDPYLAWLDATNFRSSPAFQDHNAHIPVIQEDLGNGRPRFKTNARKRSVLAELVAANADATPRFRYEVAPGVLEGSDPNLLKARKPATSMRLSQSRSNSRSKVLVGVIDFGCAFASRQFRRNDGADWQTRVLAIWDQAGAPDQGHLTAKALGKTPLQWRTPPDFWYGAETHRDQRWSTTAGLDLNEYILQFVSGSVLDEEACYRCSGYESIFERSVTHGTHVMDLATGWPSPLEPFGIGSTVRHDADIVFVQLPRMSGGRSIGGLLRANVYDAIRYIAGFAEKDQPVVINLSYGGYAGPHDGQTVTEQAIDAFIRKQRKRGHKFDVVVPAGNARQKKLHAQGQVSRGRPIMFQWHNLPDDPTDSYVELWWPKEASCTLTVISPSGLVSAPVASPGAQSFTTSGAVTAAIISPGVPCQSPKRSMALLAVGPTRPGTGRPTAPYGTWTIKVESVDETVTLVDAWCEYDEPALDRPGNARQAEFTATSTTVLLEDDTLNSLAYGEETVVVGAYRLDDNIVAPYSGTSPGRRQTAAAPASGSIRQVLAPGEESAALIGLRAAAVLGQATARLGGTSMAAAVVTRLLTDGHLSDGSGQSTRPELAPDDGTDLADDHEDVSLPRMP